MADIVFLGKVEELSDLGGSLGAEALGLDGVGEAGDVVLALLDDNEGEGGDIRADDAAADGLSSALTLTTGAVAGVTFAEEQAGTGGEENTLLHWRRGERKKSWAQVQHGGGGALGEFKNKATN